MKSNQRDIAASNVTPIRPEADGEVPDLGRTKLNPKAREIASKLRPDEWRSIREASLFSTWNEFYDWIGANKRNTFLGASDANCVAMVMSMEKARFSETQYAAACDAIIKCRAELSKRWLDGARSLCVAIRSAEKAKAETVSRPSNNIDVDAFADLVAYGRGRLEAENLRNASPDVFRHGSELAMVTRVPEEDAATLDVLTRDAFAAYLSAYAPYVRQRGENTTQSIAPPPDVVRQLFKTPREYMPLPYLSGIVRVPTFGQDGSLHSLPGYSPKSQAFYVPPRDLVIPEVPLDEAVRLLVEDLLADFPFDGHDRDEIMRRFEGREALPASLVNAMALLVEPFVRAMIAGPTPGVLVSKPEAGTGATHLVECLQTIVSGVPNVRPPLSNNEEERRKVLFTAIKAGEPVMCFDNVKGTIDSPTLASVLTSTTFTDRELGASKERSLPVRSTTVFTSNNVLFSEELQRRLSLIRIDTKMSDPKARTNWRHADLLGWAAANRGKLIGAVLALVKNWVAKRCHGPKHCPAVPSYPGWCYVVGGVLETAHPSLTSFQSNRDDIAKFASVCEEEAVHELVRAWYGAAAQKDRKGEIVTPAAGDGVTASYIAGVAEADQIELPVARKRGAEEYAYNVGQLGKYLAGYNGRIVELTVKTRNEGEGAPAEKTVAVEIAKLDKRDHNTTQWALIERETKATAVATDRPRVPETYRGFPLTIPECARGTSPLLAPTSAPAANPFTATKGKR